VTAIFLGFVGAAWTTRAEVALAPGARHEVAGYDLLYLGPRVCPGSRDCSPAEQADLTKTMTFADVEVRRAGRLLGRVSPAHFSYRSSPQSPTSEVGLLRRLGEDVYLVAGAIGAPGEPTTFRCHINPLVSCIWSGLLAIIAGALISLWPDRAAAARPPTPPARELLLLLVPVVAAAGVGWLAGVTYSLWVVAGLALLAAIWFGWQSLLGLDPATTLTLADAMALSAPSADDDHKRSILQSIQDLDLDHDLGKLSDADYAGIAQQYRDAAERLIDDPARLAAARDRVEAMLSRRLAQRDADPREDPE
jgi:hypothetical protein